MIVAIGHERALLRQFRYYFDPEGFFSLRFLVPRDSPHVGRLAKSGDQQKLEQVHPSGLEPLTFGSVDTCSRDVSGSIASDLRHDWFVEVSTLDPDLHEVAEAAASGGQELVDVWSRLPESVRSAVRFLLQPWLPDGKGSLPFGGGDR